jgi:uncharacterized Fe-S cluster-containing radical SAM superfamily protein
MVSLISTEQMVELMRARVLDPGMARVLVSKIEGSDQQADLTAPTNADGLGRIRHFRRTVAKGWPDNPLPILPASRWLGIEPPRQMRAQVFQLSGCAWRCWYCYVPFNMLSADVARSQWRTSSELLQLYLAETDRPAVLDLSGGSPDLAPEWIAWTMDSIEEIGAKATVYLWSDDNLSSDLLLDRRRSLLARMESYGGGYGKVCCLKGFDPISFSFNTGAEERGFGEQLRILKGYSESKLDLYLYITMTAPPRTEDSALMRDFVRRLHDIRTDLPFRTVPLFVGEFRAMKNRINSARREALENQWRLVEIWRDCIGALGSGPALC